MATANENRNPANGLKNVNNNCYMNAVIQCLGHLPGFCKRMQQNLFINKSSAFKGRVVHETQYLINVLWQQKRGSFSCESLKRYLGEATKKYNTSHHEDAQEFLSDILEWLHTDLLVKLNVQKVPGQWYSASPIETLFGIKVVTEIKCPYVGPEAEGPCNFISTSSVTSTMLTLDLGDATDLGGSSSVDVQSCLRKFSLPCDIEYKCCKCTQVSMNATQEQKLERLPPYLILHLARFQMKLKPALSLRKNNCSVDFPLDLRMGSQCYKLTAVVNHSGSLQSGHYTAMCRNGTCATSGTPSKNSLPYILLYESVSPADPLRLPLKEKNLPGLPTRNPSDVPVNPKNPVPSHNVPFPATQVPPPNISYPPNRTAPSSIPIPKKPIPPPSLPISKNPVPSNNMPFTPNQVPPPNISLPPNRSASSNLPIPKKPVQPLSLPISKNPVPSTKIPLPQNRVLPLNIPTLQYRNTPSNIPIPQNRIPPPTVPNPVPSTSFVPQKSIDIPVATTTLEIVSGGIALTLNPPSLKTHSLSTPHVSGHGYGQTSELRVLAKKRKLTEVDPLLRPQDVPGALLKTENLGSYTGDELKRWLACRGVMVSGNKADLISRIQAHVKMGKSNRIDPKIDNGYWHEKKRAKVVSEMKKSGIPEPPVAPTKNWRPFPSYEIPKGLTKVSVDKYLKDDCPTFKFSRSCGVRLEDSDDDPDDPDDDLEPVEYQVKSNFRRASKYLKSGNILCVLDNYDGVHYYIKAQVQASMEDKIHVVRAAINEGSGEVVDCSCECKAAALRRCSHIVAVLLLLLEHIDTRGHDAVTCTGRECYWNTASRPKNPGIIKQKGNYYPKRDTERRATFDPRGKRFQNEDVDYVAKLLSLLKTSKETNSMWSLQLKTAAKKYAFNAPIASSDAYLPDAVFDPYDGPPRDEDTVKEQCSVFFWLMNWVRNYHTTPLEITKTKGQSENGFWYSERCVRATASSAKEVLGLTSPMAKMNFLRKHMWGLDRFESPAMKYGKDSEPFAREDYLKEIQKEDPEAIVREMGTCINPDFPQLSCSPDGLLFSEVLGDRLLEIKCPAVLEEGDPNHFEEYLHQKQKGHFFLKRNKYGSLELKKTNNYYYQIQMSMAILKLTLCDFVVWSKKGMLILTINFDISFWQEKQERLIAIHRSLFVPEHFFMRTPRYLFPQELIYPAFHEDHEDIYFVN